MMPALIIINIFADVPARFLRTPIPARPVWRHAWLARAGDIILSPVEIPADFLRYVGSQLGQDLSSVRVVVDEDACTRDDQLPDDRIVDLLRPLIALQPHWTVNRSYSTPGVALLAKALQISLGGSAFILQNGNEFVNRKVNFRRLAAGADLPIPSGVTCANRAAVANAIATLITETGEVIVKRDNGGGGYGNVVLTQFPRSASRGALRTKPIDLSSIPTTVSEIWESLTDGEAKPVVVEVYHHTEVAFYFDFLIDDESIVTLKASGDILVGGDSGEGSLPWLGLQIPSAISPSLSDQALAHARPFIERISFLGYRGFINIDAIVGHDGAIYFNEVNGRWGGGTVMAEIVRQRQGASPGWTRSLRDMPCLSINATSALISAQSGVDEWGIVLTLDRTGASGMELLLHSPSRHSIASFEKRVREAWPASSTKPK